MKLATLRVCGFAVILALVAGDALAQRRGGGRAAQLKTTCFNMGRAFDALVEEHPDNPNLPEARETAERGLQRCRQGAHTMGIGILENAFGMLGELPQGRR